VVARILTWADVQELGWLLYDVHPEENPLDLSREGLRSWLSSAKRRAGGIGWPLSIPRV
jgi:hypothetical protein